MRPYILASAINIGLLVSLFLIGTTNQERLWILFWNVHFLTYNIIYSCWVVCFSKIYNIQKLLARHCGICNVFLYYHLCVPIKYN